jgi:hypothetical protein
MAVGLFKLFLGWPTCLLSKCVHSVPCGMCVCFILDKCWVYLCLQSTVISFELYVFHSSLISSFVPWSDNVYPATDVKKTSALPCHFSFHSCLKVKLSHPYRSIGTSMILCNFNSVSLLLVVNCVWLFHTYTETLVDFCIHCYCLYIWYTYNK